MKILASIVILLISSCGPFSPNVTTDNTGEIDTNSKGDIEVTITTTLDKILQICEVIDESGKVIPYSEWTIQKECLKLFDASLLKIPK